MNKFIFLFIIVVSITSTAASVQESDQKILEPSTSLRPPQTTVMRQGTTITIRKSWWTKIKESFLIASIGFFFFLFSFPLLWYNERRYVQTNKLIDNGKKSVIELNNEKVNHDLEGKLVYTTGLTKTPDSLVDKEVNIVFDDVIKVRRTVEMLQIVQLIDGRSDRNHFGGAEETNLNIKYEPMWTEMPIDSSTFRDHTYRGANPDPNSWVIESKWFKSPSVKVGEYHLSPSQINRMMIYDNCIIENFKIEKFSAALKSKLNGAYIFNTKNEIYIRFKDAQEDSIGDLRITYSLYRNKDVSIVASQSGASFVPYDLTTKPLGNSNHPYLPNRGNEELEMSNVCCCCLCCGLANACADALCQVPTEIDWLFEQKLKKDEAFNQMKAINSALTGVFRFLGFFTMWLGIFLFFFPLYEFLQAIPLLTYFGQFVVAIFALVVAIPLTILIIALAWLFYRPLVTFLLALIIIPFVIYLNKVEQEAEKAGVLTALF